MKIIDLLNKIANGENIKNIKYQNHIYEYYNGDFREEIDGAYDSNWLFANEIIDLSNLNDEIEILDNLEEKKKIPEKLNIEDDGNTITLYGEKENEWTILDNVDIIVCNKINEIIDYLDYLKSKGE